jgi:hypothetical protein
MKGKTLTTEDLLGRNFVKARIDFMIERASPVVATIVKEKKKERGREAEKDILMKRLSEKSAKEKTTI